MRQGVLRRMDRPPGALAFPVECNGKKFPSIAGLAGLNCQSIEN